MNPEKREQIEDAINAIERRAGILSMFTPEQVLIRFARQQLNLRVDGRKLLCLLRAADKEESMEVGLEKHLEALVMECLTTEEKP